MNEIAYYDKELASEAWRSSQLGIAKNEHASGEK